MRTTALPLAVSCILLILSGCGVGVPAGPDQHEARSIELDKAEAVRAEVKIPVGDLNIGGGSARLLDTDITYNVAAWKPEIRYSSGDLMVEQNGPSSTTGNTKNDVKLRFNDSVPIDLTVRFGAGDANLNLGSMNLRGVDVQMGAGDLKLDLRGAPKKDYSVRIRGGAGDATIHLPKSAGISAKIAGGIGDVAATGLSKTGDRYVSDNFDTAAVKIRLDVQAAVGSVKLIAE